MISFVLQRDRPEHSGLVMELSAEATSAYPVAASSVWVSEDAFGFLEPVLERCCPGYKAFSHWGVTEIRREEWLAIKEEWRRLANSLEYASTASEYSETVWLQSEEAKAELRENFHAIRSGLPEFISQLCEWVEATLAARQSIFLKGI